MANVTKYGLAGSVWTSDERRGYDVASRIESGILWVNCWLYRDLRTPFGGIKQSGVGREGGQWSIGFFSETRNVCVKLAQPREGGAACAGCASSGNVNTQRPFVLVAAIVGAIVLLNLCRSRAAP